jgi:hypothetical protein
MRINKVDVWDPVWWIIGIVLCATGQVSWWVFVLIVISHFEITWSRTPRVRL